jgi:hypothetical protein
MKNFLGFVDVLNLYLNASSMAWEKRVVLNSCRHFKIRYKRIHVIQRQVFFYETLSISEYPFVISLQF